MEQWFVVYWCWVYFGGQVFQVYFVFGQQLGDVMYDIGVVVVYQVEVDRFLVVYWFDFVFCQEYVDIVVGQVLQFFYQFVVVFCWYGYLQYFSELFGYL